MRTEPNNIDPEAWARFNEQLPRLCDIAIEVVELPQAVNDLTLAVRRAASELHGLSEKSDRIAEQLYAALARFAKETGQP
jgi:hypothetical protein